MRSLLAGVTAADIRTEPFPHIVIPDVMDAPLYEALATSFPGFSRIGWAASPDRIPSNRRIAMSAHLIMQAPDFPDCWKQFTALHSGPEFLGEVAALFKDHWDPDMLDALDGGFGGHPWERLNLAAHPTAEKQFLQDARIEVNTPVRDKPSSSRGAHLDTPNRLFSGLFYMRAPEDDSIGGELVLYRWRREPGNNFTANVLPDEDVEEVVRIPYRANQLVMFPQRVTALHGVGIRHPTQHIRRYVFITAEISQDWLRPRGAM